MTDTAARLNRLVTLAGEFPPAQRRSLLLQLSDLMQANACAYSVQERINLDAIIARVAATLEPAQRAALDLHEEELVALLREGRREEFFVCFTQATGLDEGVARRALEGMDGMAIAAACRKAGFARSTYSAIVLLSDPHKLRSHKKTRALLNLYDDAPPASHTAMAAE